MITSVNDIVIGAVGTGAVGLLFFFAKRYFTNREEMHRDTKRQSEKAALDIAGIQARLDEQSKILLETRDDVKFLIKQMAKVFTYIDAPERTTDKARISS